MHDQAKPVQKKLNPELQEFSDGLSRAIASTGYGLCEMAAAKQEQARQADKVRQFKERLAMSREQSRQRREQAK